MEISHPLHHHPLTLLSRIPGSRAHNFNGIEFLDPAALTTANGNVGSTFIPNALLNMITRNSCSSRHSTKNSYFCHKHALKFCNLKDSYDQDCCCCKQRISGSAYCCLECGFFIHESCKEIPKQVQHPFHPQHLLLAQAETHLNKFEYIRCKACESYIEGIKISCNMCNFDLHVSCANPNRWACALKHNCHHHNMYYFLYEDDDIYPQHWRRPLSFSRCKKCHETCLKESFYRCVKCDFNLHLKCIPIPSVVTVTQKHHHPLTLIDSVKEDNPLIQYLMDSNDKVDHSMDYYCDVCETPGNPKHHAYCCKECIYIAHVECIISKDNTSPEIISNLNPTHGAEPKKEQNNTSDDE